MVRDEMRRQQDMNEALDHTLSEERWDELQSAIAESQETAEQWENLQKTDQFLRETPLVAPSPGFAERVMAAISSLPLPGFQRELGIGIALGLLAMGLVAIPFLAVMFVIILSVLTNPGAITSFMASLFSVVGYLISLGTDIFTQVENRTVDTPILIALITTMIPVTLLWAGLIWQIVGGAQVLNRRPKS